MLAGGEGSSFSGGWTPGWSTPLHPQGARHAAQGVQGLPCPWGLESDLRGPCRAQGAMCPLMKGPETRRWGKRTWWGWCLICILK